VSAQTVDLPSGIRTEKHGFLRRSIPDQIRPRCRRDADLRHRLLGGQRNACGGEQGRCALHGWTGGKKMGRHRTRNGTSTSGGSGGWVRFRVLTRWNFESRITSHIPAVPDKEFPAVALLAETMLLIAVPRCRRSITLPEGGNRGQHCLHSLTKSIAITEA
jgi:hypothetical protein